MLMCSVRFGMRRWQLVGGVCASGLVLHDHVLLGQHAETSRQESPNRNRQKIFEPNHGFCCAQRCHVLDPIRVCHVRCAAIMLPGAPRPSRQSVWWSCALSNRPCRSASICSTTMNRFCRCGESHSPSCMQASADPPSTCMLSISLRQCTLSLDALPPASLEHPLAPCSVTPAGSSSWLSSCQ